MQKKYSVKTPFFMVRNRISSLRASLRGAERLSARVIARSGTHLLRVSLRGVERSGATKQSHHSEREFVLWGCFVVVPPSRNGG